MADHSSYVSEPDTSGKVVLKTNIGDLDVELWSNECPIACRNFVQHCLDGYYNKCQFYYVEPGVRAFTGDPTNTGNGGESAFGGVFRDEHHSRLRFTRRGLVAMMGKDKKHSNTSHFFITFQAAPQFDLKHTIFGMITGHTAYNVNHLAKREVVENHYTKPVTILETVVVNNPFPDLKPRKKQTTDPSTSIIQSNQPSLTQLKTNNAKLLSFGNDDGDDDDVFAQDVGFSKIKAKLRRKKQPHGSLNATGNTSISDKAPQPPTVAPLSADVAQSHPEVTLPENDSQQGQPPKASDMDHVTHGDVLRDHSLPTTTVDLHQLTSHPHVSPNENGHPSTEGSTTTHHAVPHVGSIEREDNKEGHSEDEDEDQEDKEYLDTQRKNIPQHLDFLSLLKPQASAKSSKSQENSLQTGAKPLSSIHQTKSKTKSEYDQLFSLHKAKPVRLSILPGPPTNPIGKPSRESHDQAHHEADYDERDVKDSSRERSRSYTSSSDDRSHHPRDQRRSNSPDHYRHRDQRSHRHYHSDRDYDERERHHRRGDIRDGSRSRHDSDYSSDRRESNRDRRSRQSEYDDSRRKTSSNDP